MARKRKLQQRVKAVGEQIEASIREDAELQKLEFVASEELFQIDTAGGKLTKKQKLKQKDPVVKSHKFIAEKANKFEAERVKKLAQRAPEAGKKAAKKAGEAPIWGSDGAVAVDKKLAALDPYVAPAVVKKVAVPKRVASTRHRIKKVAVPAPGQSYHPDFESHQDVLAEAVAKELEKQAIQKEQREPLAKGLSEETRQFIKEGSDDDESESENEEGEGSKMRRREKLTIAQRNKRARHKQMELSHKAKRSEKSLVKQINTSKHLLQEILKEEKLSQKKQELKKVIAEQKLDEEPMVKIGREKTKIVRDTPVLLSDELTGSLRGLKPKGDPLLDRFDSLHKRNMIVANNSRAKGKRKVKIIEVKK